MDNHHQIEKYLHTKRNAWKDTTLKSVRATLNKVSPILNGDPNLLWEYMDQSGMKSYSRVTTWTRVIGFWDFISDSNPYKKFRKDKARFFKNSYVRKQLGITYEEAIKKIKEIPEEKIKKKALQIIYNGLRFEESNNIQKGWVKGKGEKCRRVFIEVDTVNLNYRYFYDKLKKYTGLKPHDLRKLAATRYAEAGMKEADILKVFGWSSIVTAQYYLQPKKDSELKSMMEDVIYGK